MDSGNSGSMSSSGDEEYDSRTESIPSFLNSSSSTHHHHHHFASNSESNPSPTSDTSHLLSHHLFDLSPSSGNFLQPNSSSNPNFLLNLDMASTATLRSRSDGLRSDHHHHHQLYQLGPPSSSSSGSHQYAAGPSAAFHLQQQQQQQQQPPVQNDNISTTGALRSGTTVAATTTSAQTTVGRNSKKRTRASRRAPTTVLTTDTSNFRAMVQEFTGIPAPPFSGSSFSRRLDLFGSGSAIRSGGASHFEGPFYPLRPSAQKPQTSLFGNIASSSTSSSPLFSNVMVDATNIASSSLNFQPSSSDHHHHHHQGMISKQPRNILSMQNLGINNMAFQSLPLHPNSLDMAGFGAKQQGQESNLAMCTTTSAHDNNQELNASYRSRIDSNQVASDGTVVPLTRQDLAWRVEGTAGSGDSCKLNYAAGPAANSSEFQVEKGLEINVSTRNEGTVDPWIYPSD